MSIKFYLYFVRGLLNQFCVFMRLKLKMYNNIIIIITQCTDGYKNETTVIILIFKIVKL